MLRFAQRVSNESELLQGVGQSERALELEPEDTVDNISASLIQFGLTIRIQ